MRRFSTCGRRWPGVLALLALASWLASGTGCRQRLTGFTLLTNREIHPAHMGRLERVEEPVTGEDIRPILLGRAEGVPDLETAVDRAIDSVDGGVALVDGWVEWRWWSVFLWGEAGYRVRAAVLRETDGGRVTGAGRMAGGTHGTGTGRVVPATSPAP